MSLYSVRFVQVSTFLRGKKMALQYKTLYQSLKKVYGEWHSGHVEWGYLWNYLKFYDDGTVIYC